MINNLFKLFSRHIQPHKEKENNVLTHSIAQKCCVVTSRVRTFEI